MFTKKHFEAVAHILKEADAEDLAAHFADIFEQDNPRFNRKRFMAACGFDAPKGHDMGKVARAVDSLYGAPEA